MFGAEGELWGGGPIERRIGDSRVMVSDSGGAGEAWPAFLSVYVPDADEAYRRAMALKVLSIEVPADVPDGDRRAMVRDQWGNTWQIATRTLA